MARIKIADELSIDERELEEAFIQASGPGGQNVNKVATAVQLRFNAAGSPSLPEAVRRRLCMLAGRRMTRGGALVIIARRFRTQELNRLDARQRLIDLIRAAAVQPKPRLATKPTAASKRRRLEMKTARSSVKRNRATTIREED